jgi:hypothetical protein
MLIPLMQRALQQLLKLPSSRNGWPVAMELEWLAPQVLPLEARLPACRDLIR